MNRGDGHFVEAGAAVGLDHPGDARGLAAADFDLDGDIDFVVNNYRGPAAMFINSMAAGAPWIGVRLEGTHSNRDGIGSKVTLRTGDKTQTRWVAAGHGYAGQNSAELLFAASSEGIVSVRWPSGLEEQFGPVAPRRRLTLREGEGRAKPQAAAPAPAPAAEPVPALPREVLAVMLGFLGLFVLRHVRA